MLQGVYATLGIFLILAARAPHEHRSLILFTAWSSLVHAGIMAVQALRDTAERGHLTSELGAGQPRLIGRFTPRLRSA
jgi:hypothetical protein